MITAGQEQVARLRRSNQAARLSGSNPEGFELLKTYLAAATFRQ